MPEPRERAVVITGIGSVNAIALGGSSTMVATLASGRSAIGPVRAFDVDGAPSRLAAEVDDAALAGLVDADAARRLSRICRLTLAASRLALADARLEVSALPDEAPLGMVIGTEHGDFRSSEAFAAGFLRRGIAGLSPMTFPNTVMNAMGAVAAIAVQARGPTVTINQPTVAGDLAVGRGIALVAAGRAGAVLAGGVDEICGPVYRRLAALRALSPMGGSGPEGCRPFATDHNGPVMGEGATFVVLEERGLARARGATVLAEVLGAAWSNIPVAPHTAPRRRRDRASPVRRLLDGLQVAPSRLTRCYAAGNGDPDLDDWEAALLSADLGDAAAISVPGDLFSLAPIFGQHAGLGAIRVGAAALDLAGADRGPALVHGIARGGGRTAILLGRAA
jgi:3-oxoacyl-[acyl-carrier-protein] synthase II